MKSPVTREELICLMRYPKEWVEWEMLPGEFVDAQIATYEPGNENASEHFRNGAFHYWLKRNPSKEILIKLVKLSFLDPDVPMANWLRNDCITKAVNADNEVLALLKGGFK